MTLALIELALMLLVILGAAELFTNALEHVGDRMAISQGVTGSLFAAVGTALPETMVPLLAIFAGSGSSATNQEVGVGAILGAPLMLATLAPFLLAMAVLPARGLAGRVVPERSGYLRDLHFFLFAFALAAVAMFVPAEARLARGAIGVLLVVTYVVYVAATLRASSRLVEQGHVTEAENRLHASRLGLSSGMASTLAQLVVALALLIVGAHGFVGGVETLSTAIGISPLLLSLLIIPVATELPEKVNSILWSRRGKDTLAMGNLTGAMVFQGTLLPAIGIMLTPWTPRFDVLCGVAVTLLATLWLRACARRDGIPVWTFVVCGVLYFGFIAVALVGP